MSDKVDSADSGSVERVAYDLMQLIRSGGGISKNETEILGLYYRCLQVVKGAHPN